MDGAAAFGKGGTKKSISQGFLHPNPPPCLDVFKQASVCIVVQRKRRRRVALALLAQHPREVLGPFAHARNPHHQEAKGGPAQALSRTHR